MPGSALKASTTAGASSNAAESRNRLSAVLIPSPSLLSDLGARRGRRTPDRIRPAAARAPEDPPRGTADGVDARAQRLPDIGGDGAAFVVIYRACIFLICASIMAGELLGAGEGLRSMFGFERFTGPGRNTGARGKAGQKVVAGELFPAAAVPAFRLWEAFDAVGHVGQIHRPLHAGRGATAAEGPLGDRFARNDRRFRPDPYRCGPGEALFVNVHRGRPKNSRIEFCETARKGRRTVTRLIRTRFGGGGVRRTPSRWCRYLHTRGRGGRRGRFVADQFGRMFADENNVARGTSEMRF